MKLIFYRQMKKYIILIIRFFIRGNPAMGKYSFKAIKEYSFFTDRRIVFKGVDTLDLEYERSAG